MLHAFMPLIGIADGIRQAVPLDRLEAPFLDLLKGTGDKLIDNTLVRDIEEVLSAPCRAVGEQRVAELLNYLGLRRLDGRSDP